MAICLNFDYEAGTLEMFLNGEKQNQKIVRPLVLPEDSTDKPLIIRFGRYYYDDTPLIGMIVDINIWDRY